MAIFVSEWCWLWLYLPVLMYSVYNFYPVSNYNWACVYILRAFWFSFSENDVHSVCLFLLVCFFPLFVEPIYQEISPLIYELQTFFPICHCLCACMHMCVLLIYTYKSISGFYPEWVGPKLKKYLVFLSF